MKTIKLILSILFLLTNIIYAEENKITKFSDYYMAVKIVSAEMASLVNENGYRIKYNDGDIGWVAAEEFNRMYLPIGKNYYDIDSIEMFTLIEYWLKNLKIIENSDGNVSADIVMPGGSKEYFDGTKDISSLRLIVYKEVESYLRLMLKWATRGIGKNINIGIPTPLSDNSIYYLGAKIIKAHKSNSATTKGYTVQYPEGDIGWITEEIFKKMYIYIGSIEDIYNPISNEFIEKFTYNIFSDEAWENRTGIKRLTIDTLPEYTISIEKALNEKETKELLYEKVGRHLNFIKKWGLYGVRDSPPYNANLDYTTNENKNSFKNLFKLNN